MTNDEIKRKIEEMLFEAFNEYELFVLPRPYSLTVTDSGKKLSICSNYADKLLPLFTEMVEGELRGFVEYMEKNIMEGAELKSNPRDIIEQYLLERKNK